jgi:hypothetical protein
MGALIKPRFFPNIRLLVVFDDFDERVVLHHDIISGLVVKGAALCGTVKVNSVKKRKIGGCIFLLDTQMFCRLPLS